MSKIDSPDGSLRRARSRTGHQNLFKNVYEQHLWYEKKIFLAEASYEEIWRVEVMDFYENVQFLIRRRPQGGLRRLPRHSGRPPWSWRGAVLARTSTDAADPGLLPPLWSPPVASAAGEDERSDMVVTVVQMKPPNLPDVLPVRAAADSQRKWSLATSRKSGQISLRHGSCRSIGPTRGVPSRL